jgi:hypothetical protein
VHACFATTPTAPRTSKQAGQDVEKRLIDLPMLDGRIGLRIRRFIHLDGEPSANENDLFGDGPEDGEIVIAARARQYSLITHCERSWHTGARALEDGGEGRKRSMRVQRVRRWHWGAGDSHRAALRAAWHGFLTDGNSGNGSSVGICARTNTQDRGRARRAVRA